MLRMGSSIPCVVLVLFSSICASSSAWAAAPQTSEDWQERVEALQRCFEQRLKTLPDIHATGLTYHYVVDRLADPETAWEHGAVEVVCDSVLFAPYRRAYDDMRIAARLPFAMPGTWGLDSESRLLNFLTRRGPYSHVPGHSDITAQSLGLLGEPLASADVVSLIGRAAQAPDVYAWSTTCLHAHTEASADEVSEALVASSREAYVERAAQFLAQFDAYVAAEDDAPALFTLGLVLHGVQDLAYHRGMTFAEHSGLAYYMGRNPDILPEPDFTRVLSEAEQLTLTLLNAVRLHVGTSVWTRLMRFQQPTTFDLHALSRALIPNARDVTFSELMEYWRLSLRYRYGSAQRREDLTQAGVGRWDIASTLTEVLSRSGY